VIDKPKYTTPQAFKQALDDHLRKRGQGRDLGRLKQLVIFDRLLARLADEFGDAIVLKGGLALRLRLQRARTTTDIDVRYSGGLDSLLPRLQQAGKRDLGDFMTFEIREDSKHPIIDSVYQGRRYTVTAKLAGKTFGASSFGLDVGVGEKLHAYTLVYDTYNGRAKDLYDMALMSMELSVASERLRAAIDQTFSARDKHGVPTDLPDPPSQWASSYPADQVEFGLPWSTLADCHRRARQFVGPVLAGIQASIWSPEAGEWLLRG
jgi:hypothetical protein